MPVYWIEILVVLLAVVALIADAFAPAGKRIWIGRCLPFGLLATVVALFTSKPLDPLHGLSAFYASDSITLNLKALILLISAVVIAISAEYQPVLQRLFGKKRDDLQHDDGLGEFYALPLLATAGLCWMVSAKDFITAFVSLELVTIAFYVLVAYGRRNVGSLEAGVKYLVLGALSTGFFVYGMAWLFGLTGTFQFEKVAQVLSLGNAHQPAVIWTFALLFFGLSFKIAAVPFQFWAPDVYQGAPTPVSAFLATGSKVASFVLMAKVLEAFYSYAPLSEHLGVILGLVACATLLIGAFGAIQQNHVKRLLGYSSIANAGFLLAILAAGPRVVIGIETMSAVCIYLTAYVLSTLLTFSVLTSVRRLTGSENSNQLAGLAKRSPWLSFALIVGLAGLAGLPLTAGFFGKFLTFAFVWESGNYALLVIAGLAGLAGFYYYFKLIRVLFDGDSNTPLNPSFTIRLLTGILTALVLILGIAPTPIVAPFVKSTPALEASPEVVSTQHTQE